MADAPQSATRAVQGGVAAGGDPDRIVTRRDFARELTLVRELAGLTVRDVAKAAGIPDGSAGDYFAGRHLPPLRPARLPVILRACGVTDARTVGRWEAALLRVRRRPGRRAATPPPYRGLASFQPEDAEWFFGRERLTAALLRQVAEHRTRGGLLAVVGPSGSGKSSVLRAGLIPALETMEAAGRSWPWSLFTPGADPLGELAGRLIGLARMGVTHRDTSDAAAEKTANTAELTDIDATEAPDVAGAPDVAAAPDVAEVTEALRRSPRFAAELAERARAGSLGEPPGGAAGPDSRPLVLVVDQFEEVFTGGCAPADRRAFVSALAAAAGRGRPAVVVIGLRADFYARALRDPRLARVLQAAQTVVAPMSEAELRNAITGPAHKAGLRLEEGLVELLLRELAPSPGDEPAEAAHEAGALPLLSHALLATWERRHHGTLTIADYRESGGIEGAVSRTAEEVHARLDPGQQRIARKIFVRLVHIADDTGDTRRRAARAELALGDEAPVVLDRFIEERLITATADEVEITHEALLVAWPRLRRWLDADRAGLRTHRRLTVAAEAWQAAGRDRHLLLRDLRLAEVAEWAGDSGNAADLNPLESAFLAASTAQQAAEARATRRRARRRRQRSAALAALSLIAVSLAAYSFRQGRVAGHERDLAVSRRIAVVADRLRSKDVALAGQLSLAAYHIAKTPEARSSLLQSYAEPAVTRVPGGAGVMQSVAFTADGRTMATGGTDRRVRLWNVGDRSRPAPAGPPLEEQPDTVFSVAFSPDGRSLAAGGGGRALSLWRAPAGPVGGTGGTWRRQVLTGPQGTVYSVCFAPGGRMLAAGSADGTVRLWDLRDPERPAPLGRPLTGPRGPVQSVAYSPDGRTLAEGSADGTVRLWDLSDPGRPAPLGRPLTASAKTVFSVAFSPDGRALAAGTADFTVRLWHLSRRPASGPASGTARGPVRGAVTGRPLTGPKGWINSVAFSPDGGTLAAAGSDGKVWLWDPVSHAVTGTLQHPGPVTSVVFRGAGSLGTAASDGTARIWDLPGPSIPGSGADVFAASFDAGGRTVAAVGADGTARLWTAGDPRRPMPVGPQIGDALRHGRVSGAGGLSPDGRLLAIGGVDGATRLWDLTERARPVPLPVLLTGPAQVVQGVTFGPDGRLLAVATNDHTVWLWDVSDPRHPVRATAPLTGAANYAFQAAFSGDGRMLAYGSADGRVHLWDVTDPHQPVRLGGPLSGHRSYAITVAFSPDGRYLASGGADSRVLLWDLTDRHRPRALRGALTGPENYVNSLAYDSTGSVLAAVGGDGSIWLWDVSRPGRPQWLATLTGSPDALYVDAFTAGRPILLTAGAGGRIRLWNTDAHQVAAHLCALSGAPISRAEWDRYLAPYPYRPPCHG